MNELALPAPVALPLLERYAIAATTVSDATGELTRRMRDGDEAAWREFHAVYAPRLFRYLVVLTKGRDDTAGEALQQTFLRAVRHVRVFEAEPAFWSWLTVLARSACVDEFRRESRRLDLLERWLSSMRHEDASATANGEADAHLRELIEAGLGELTAGERFLLEQKYFNGVSVRGIAAAEQVSEKAVEARLGRARQRLRSFVLARLRHEDTD